MDYCLPPGYRERHTPEYFVAQPEGKTWQPDVYPEAAALAERLEVQKVIDVGCGTAEKLASLHLAFEVVGVDFGSNIDACRQQYDFGTWLEVDFERGNPLETCDFRDSLIICADVIEHLLHPERLLGHIADALECGARALVLSTPDRELTYGSSHLGPPPNRAHVREWTSSELKQFMAALGLHGHFGRTRSNDFAPTLRTIFVVVPGAQQDAQAIVDEWFRERTRWQRVPEAQERSFAVYETWAQELESHRDVLAARVQVLETELEELGRLVRGLGHAVRHVRRRFR